MDLSVYIETFGCQMNVADTERAATRLAESSFQLATSLDNADVVIFNTCSIRARAAQKVFNRIGEVRDARKGREPLFGVMGCVAQLEGETLFDNTAPIRLVVGTGAVNRLPELICRALSDEHEVLDLGERGDQDSWLVGASNRHSKYTAFVPIIEGCNKFCSYCIVPFSRGREKSRIAAGIIEDLQRLREQGFREVHLLGQNVNSYRPPSDDGLAGFSGATPFARLLRAVAATGFQRIKFTTSFPRDFHPDIVAALSENENLCNWVHLPVQSGSDRVLRMMRRGHTVADYVRRIEAIKASPRRIALTSDIIVGFPGETDDDFKATLQLVQLCQYDSLYIFKYSERPGTRAASMGDSVPGDVKTGRFLELEAVQRSIQDDICRRYLGSDVDVLVEGVSARSTSDLKGHTTCHKVINFPGEVALVGSVVKVRVTAAKANSLYGLQA